MTAFLGPATEKGGPKREWHHLVESNTEFRFGPERVHHIGNVGAIEKDPIHNEISKASQTIDPELGLGADGKEQSLRDSLKDKPWERHVAQGELELRKRGIDPELEFRAKTLERFEQRIELHDRLLGIQKKKASQEIAIPGVLTATDGHASSQSGERSTHSRPGDGRITHWTPDMSQEDFAKLQAQIRGGSSSRGEASSLNVERDGYAGEVYPGYKQEGRILSTVGDRIVQDVGRGHTTTYSRTELQAHFANSKAFNTMMQAGNYVNVDLSRSGVIDVQQHLPGHGWESLGQEPLSHFQQSP